MSLLIGTSSLERVSKMSLFYFNDIVQGI